MIDLIRLLNLLLDSPLERHSNNSNTRTTRCQECVLRRSGIGRTPARRGILVTIVVLLWSQNNGRNVQQ